jgi:rod shape-determining protein MreD
VSRFILPLLAMTFFVFESVYSNLFADSMFGSDRIVVPRFLMILITFLTIYGSRRTGILYGLILGIAYDVVYTEVLGIYAFFFPALAYLISKAMKVLQANLLIAGLVSLCFVAILEAAVFQVNLIIHVTAMSYSEFAVNRLVPTLLLNLAFVIIFSLPLRILIEKFNVSRDND